MNNTSKPTSYVKLALAIIIAIILLPIVWGLVKGIIRLALTVGIIGFAVYGIYVIVNKKSVS